MAISASSDISKVTRFKITRAQIVVALLAFTSLLGLGISSQISSHSSIQQAVVLTNAETPAANIIFAQRETLVYTTRLAQWSNGGLPRRDVQIARSLLTQRLHVVDSSGSSVFARATPGFVAALAAADSVVASTVPGILPESMHASIQTKVGPVIDQIIYEARQVVVQYQQSVDDELRKNAKATADRDNRNLLFLYLFVLFGGIFLAWNAATNIRTYRQARLSMSEESRRLDDLIAQLEETKNTVAQLQDLNEAKNAFISTVNHELRTPLTSIIGYIDVMKDMGTDDKKKVDDYLNVLDRNANILLNLVESMLSLSKIDSGNEKVPLHRVDVVQALDNTVFVMKPATEKSNIHISLNVTRRENYFVQGDAGQINQVMVNLLGNAIKFSPNNSRIDVTLDHLQYEPNMDMVRIRFTDHGIGIPAEDIGKLFTRFFRAKNAMAEQYPGTGLGLAIVQQVVARHGGKISVQSEVGVGTTMTVELPVYLTEEDALIMTRREGMLIRAIMKFKSASAENAKKVTHDIGGTLGFYGFEQLGEDILEFSRELDTEPRLGRQEIELRLAGFLSILESTLDEVRKEKL